MPSMKKTVGWWAGSACAVLLLGGCDGLSKVGEQDNEDTPPVADVVVLNQAFSKDAAGDVTTRVRAGTEVFLSGKDSDGLVAPVLRFEWCVVVQGACAPQSAVRLITRNSNTVSFTAPTVAQDTLVELRLKVTDSNGNTDSTDVDVNVAAVADGNHFLSYDLDDARSIRLAAIGSRPVAPAELTAGPVEFEIDVRRLVNYTTDSDNGPFLEVGQQTFRGEWLPDYGVGASCTDPENPSFHAPVPALDIDDVLGNVDPARADLEPNPAAVDRFRLKLRMTIRVTRGVLPSGVVPYVCADRIAPVAASAVAARNNAPALSAKQTDPNTNLLELSLDELLGVAGGGLDTPASAAAYYAAIDPRQERTSLGDWLRVNGFITDASSFTWEQLAASSSANAVYLNNYDLGFGRDMYARIVRCSDGAPPALGQPLPKSRRGNCDIAAVVINYASLEAATKRINPVLAVAMEYSTPVEGTRRIVQFYTFAPDAQTGRFARVRSANLDGRGEKYMPQVCTVCHGGTPGGLTSGGAYANGGDVNATFLPWDLDAFLFADSEGANSDRSYSDQSLRPRYTRSAQAEALRRLNQIAYLTYEDSTRPGRFTLPRQLVEGWYGVDAGNAFTRTSFTSDYAPAGWTPEGVDGVGNTADDNPSDATRIYHDVFARNCRACHIAHAPDPGANGSHLETLVGASQTFNTCDRDLVTDAGGQNLEPASIGMQRQAPMGCYAHFFNAPRLPERLSAGVMPFARLTMDRLWVPAPGATSAGVSLFDHLDARYRATSNAARLAALSRPGTPAARVQVSTTPAGQADIGSTLRLDGARSTFASSFGWSLERCQSAAPLEPACRGGAAAEPDPAQLVCAAASEPIVSPAGPSASFKAQGTGVYRATLRLNGNASSASGAVNVPDWRPCALSANVLDLGGVTLGTPVSIGIPALFTTGNAPLTEHRLFVTAPSALTLSRPECASAQGCAVGNGFSVTPTAVADNEVVVTLRDADGESANATLRLRGTSTLSAANITDRFIRSNESLTVDLLAANGNPANVEVELLEQDCPDGREGLACLRNPLAAVAGRDASVTPTTSGFEYRPPANFSTHDVDGAPQFAPLERFLERVRYRLRRIDNPADFSPPAAVDVPVRARTRFTVAQGVFVAAPCSTCHAGAAPIGPTYGTFPYTATPPDPMWREGDLINLGRARVDLADAEESGLVCYPMNTCTNLHNINATEEEVQVILDWISSGANNY